MTRRRLGRPSLRPSTLRGRMALLAALAAFVAATLGGAAAFAVTARVLGNQEDSALIGGSRALIRASSETAASTAEICARLAAAAPPLPTAYLVEVLGAGGDQCGAPAAQRIVTTPADVAVAQGRNSGGLRNGRGVDGARLRVFVARLHNGGALLTARDPADLEHVLDRLRFLLLVLSLVGALGALGAGLVVARAGLRPVARLTGAAEHIARTQDLTALIDVPAYRRPDEVTRLAVAFNAMITALSAAKARQAELVADAGHELRTPLTSLRTNIDLLLRSERAGRPLPAPDRTALLNGIAAQLHELSDLVGELVAMAADSPHVDMTSVRLDDVVKAAVQRVRHRAADRRMTVATSPWVLPGDPIALERAVVNVLDNAVKFSPPASTIHVRQASGVIEVSDAGRGLPPGQRQQAFSRFWRAETARGLPGSGLGLAIVADVVTSHGGTARMESAADGGALVVLSLPGSLPGRPAARSAVTEWA